MTGVIARREFHALLKSPFTWLIAAILQVFFAWYFLSTLEQYLAIQHQLALQDHAPGVTAFLAFRYLAPICALLLLICPLLTMRCLADEYRHHTFALLQSSPVPVHAIVLGKFIGVMGFVSLLLLLAILMPLSLLALTDVDLPLLGLSLLGLIITGAMCTAAGLFFSSLTKNTMIAAITSSTVLLLLWILGKGTYSDAGIQTAMTSLSTSTHLGTFFQGLLDTRDVLYFFILTTLFLSLTMIRISSFNRNGAPI